MWGCKDGDQGCGGATQSGQLTGPERTSLVLSRQTAWGQGEALTQVGTPPTDHRHPLLAKSGYRRTEGSSSLAVEGAHWMDSALDAFEGLPQPQGQDPAHRCHLSLVSTHLPIFLVTFIFPLTKVPQGHPSLPSLLEGEIQGHKVSSGWGSRREGDRKDWKEGLGGSRRESGMVWEEGGGERVGRRGGLTLKIKL